MFGFPKRAQSSLRDNPHTCNLVYPNMGYWENWPAIACWRAVHGLERHGDGAFHVRNRITWEAKRVAMQAVDCEDMPRPKTMWQTGCVEDRYRTACRSPIRCARPFARARLNEEDRNRHARHYRKLRRCCKSLDPCKGKKPFQIDCDSEGRLRSAGIDADPMTRPTRFGPRDWVRSGCA